jgi:CheY-like chemotaxis protein
MPDMTGYEVLEELKSRVETADIPVIIVTSRVLHDSDRRRLAAHAIAIISKDNVNDAAIGDVVRGTLKSAAVTSQADRND